MTQDFNAHFRAIRSAIPNNVKAVNIYARLIPLPGEPGVEVSFAFHSEHAFAEACLDRAQRGEFDEGVTFARGLGEPASKWIAADWFEKK